MKITTTRNYSLFISDPSNRQITKKGAHRLKLLQISMRKYGYLPFPILVRPSGTQFKIIDGQHRFMVAQQLKLAIQYVVTDRTDINISECAAAQSPWTIFDHVASGASQGSDDCKELIEFCNQYHLPFARGASLLAGEGATSGNVNDVIKRGNFEVKDREYAQRVASLASVVREHVPWATTSNPLGAISRFVRVPQFVDAHFIKRVNTNPHMLRKQPTQDTFAEMYEAIYNHGSKAARIPLAFLSKEAARARSVATKQD